MTEPTKQPKPCIALMGEFSAGKSTLANLMLGSSPLPVQVIATRLPPVRMSYGNEEPFRLDIDGHRHDVDLSNLSDIPLATTQLIQIFRNDDILKECDLIDMPGISDPNMDTDVLQGTLPLAHAVVWCSHATQAWRQSEAAFWAEVPDNVKQKSILLLTRFDKLATGKDRERVIKRVVKEAGIQFRRILPISLLDAHTAGDDVTAWRASGADTFAKSFVAMVEGIKAEQSGEEAEPSQVEDATSELEKPKIVPRRVTRYAS